MKPTDETDRLARASRPLKRLKAHLDASQSKRVVGSTPVTVREPGGHVAHQRAALTTR